MLFVEKQNLVVIFCVMGQISGDTYFFFIFGVEGVTSNLVGLLFFNLVKARWAIASKFYTIIIDYLQLKKCTF